MGTLPLLVNGFDSEERKKRPMARGLLDYFPAALAEVARISYIGNEKHNPGQAMHWARGKSTDQADCILRHLAERGGFEDYTMADGKVERVRHSAQLAWRALALLQLELEAAGEVCEAVTPRQPPMSQDAELEEHAAWKADNGF